MNQNEGRKSHVKDVFFTALLSLMLASGLSQKSFLEEL